MLVSLMITSFSVSVFANESFCGHDPVSGAYICIDDDGFVVNSSPTPSGACAGSPTTCNGQVIY
ncbi:hypothetical protein [Mongoliibacter ruber]|uniref:hypothetical protein n=1 Tax=Mongoliibacter ruber TaxID=1750599 RepID=UPI0011B241CD|nr:hypothetical protein [Mongoliibacter ruber]